ncbi:MAG: glycoside hydrolase [Betaproteobacteria bacterium]|jgi:alpha-amylase/alpha-mannosidase (GH57 family)|nr:glycoside hydrolase [Betaproteobacteria bacterium]HMV20630.1 glycoside hydrolase family 57 protein [Rhodocyclaceae bacterium]HNE41861.1 glycoside hydrolase family 57 protein [Rhodocyclaceae bacterium]HNM81356.1 glycoside hydrolase family 57 protein [Rhodocyclaceae bacterium]
MAEVAFLWHMHQPDYRHPESGEFVLPWVLLHAIKDYADMAGHLERHPAIRCTVNFVPVLLDQIEDYADQFASRTWRDPLLAVAACREPDRLSREDRDWLLDMAFRCHAPTMLEPFAPYRRLRDLHVFVQGHDGPGIDYLSGQYFADLATWTLLAWSGETLRRDGTAIPELMAKGAGFTLADRDCLLTTLGGVVANLIPRYRALAERGQIELACTPGAHPLAPLLLDFASARESWPDCPLPEAPEYPGGRSRAQAHLECARASHTRRFGQPPAGLWPAEGALSQAFLAQIGEAGFAWTASSQSVLKNSAGPEASVNRPWQAPAGTPGSLTLFFRNERLSDLIGFEYAKWHGRDAAAHFIAELEVAATRDPAAVVPVFLDGENAWEYYPYNAWYFFEDLYGALEEHASLATTTLGAAAADRQEDRSALPKLTAGSWVYGTFSTWIGDPAKNRAWELLCDAKQCADRALDSSRLAPAEREAVAARLAVCESSDWFWWFGDYNPPQSVASFDALFRDNLKALYRLLRLPVPAALEHPISQGGGAAESGGTMRRAS